MSPLRSIVATALTLGCVAFASATPAQVAGETNTPPRSSRFVEIANVDGYSGFFNLGQGTVRMMAILSPTCDECVAVFHEIHRIMDSTPTNRLRTYVVLVPAHEDDLRARALMLAAEMNERRASHFWDPNLAVANAFKSLADDGEPVTSGCFVFDTNAVMRDVPEAPALKMYPHAHDGDHRFNGERLEARVNELLAAFEAEQRRRRPADRE